jgi:hypothetical protein
MGARDLLNTLSSAGLAVSADGGNLVIRPRELLTIELRETVRARKLELLALLASPAREDPQGKAQEHHTQPLRAIPAAPLRRLRGAGLDPDDADALAAWIRARDADADDRRLCIECAHFAERGKVCRHPKLVAIQAPRDLGQLATTPQRCGGFKERR